MPGWAGIAGAGLLGYALGSVPFGLLLTRSAGLGDIRRIGSGNIGATNVLRTGRKGLAAATLLLDGAKAAAAVLLARWWLGDPGAPVAAVAAVAGHVFPVWLRFRGGKGVASGLGALIALAWPVGAAACAAWLVAVALSRTSSIGAITAFVAAPVTALLLGDRTAAIAAVLVAALIIARHRGNIGRLLAGCEPRIGQAR